MSGAQTPALRIAPIGWVVQSAKGRALVLERPAADQLAMRTHGTVDAAYSGEQVQQILEHTGKVVLVEADKGEPHAAA